MSEIETLGEYILQDKDDQPLLPHKLQPVEAEEVVKVESGTIKKVDNKAVINTINRSSSCSSTMGGLTLYINTCGGSLIPVNYRGDSVQRAQFESMVCVMQSVIPKEKKSFRRIPPMKIFKAEEFNASIEYYWASFTLESNSCHATYHTVLR
ncbi:hypothetical protein SLE2022_318430 [Rubroshorea leprosula]